MHKRLRVGILGGGLFVYPQQYLDKDYDVTVFEQFDDILGATYANHNRHHYGYHYPVLRNSSAMLGKYGGV